MNQIWENSKKSNFRSDFGLFSPNLGPKIFFSDFYLYFMLDIVVIMTVCNLKENQWSKLRKMAKKPNSGTDLGHLGGKFGPQKLFSKTLVSSVARYHGQLSSCTISEKNNDPILRKHSEQTDGRIDVREWFHRTLFD